MSTIRRDSTQFWEKSSPPEPYTTAAQYNTPRLTQRSAYTTSVQNGARTECIGRSKGWRPKQQQ
eukprot:9966820-Heterocapsa_arctica.AAC.1